MLAEPISNSDARDFIQPALVSTYDRVLIMSRLSRANLKARDSVFAGGPELYRGDIQAICPPNLEECVMAMEDCCEEVS